jgi:cation transport regulator ChaC
VTHYFAYGSNMDPLQMEQRCPGAVVIGPARLDDHRLTFVWDSPGWGGGVATVEAATGDHVWGVLWDLTDEHVKSLDEYEGVAVGAYTREHIDVDCLGVGVNTLIYLATDTRYKAPSARYVNALIRGAMAFAVPDDYIERLRALHK